MQTNAVPSPELSLSELPITQILAVSINNPVNIAFYKSRRCFGIFYKFEGISEARIGQESWIFDKDHVVILPKNASYEIYPKVKGRTLKIEFACDESFSCDISKIYSYRISNPALMYKLFSETERIWTFKKTAFRNRCLSLLYQIIAELERDLSRSYLPARQYEAIRAAQTYLEENYADPGLDIARLSEVAGLSKSYFRRLFTEVYKLSPGQYISMIRMEKAKDLLTLGMYSVGEVAQLVGYTNIYYFSGAFKKAVGCPPSDFAERLF